MKVGLLFLDQFEPLCFLLLAQLVGLALDGLHPPLLGRSLLVAQLQRQGSPLRGRAVSHRVLIRQ
ncbi:hypothetical protein [Spirosoma arcticum]